MGLAWIAVFVPAGVRAHRATPVTAAQRFKRHMEKFAPSRGSRTSQVRGSNGRWIVVPKVHGPMVESSVPRSQIRRRKILVFLLTVTAGSLVAVVFFDFSIEVNFVADAALAFYVALLLEAKRRRLEATHKVRRIGGRGRDDVVFHEPVPSAASKGR